MGKMPMSQGEGWCRTTERGRTMRIHGLAGVMLSLAGAAAAQPLGVEPPGETFDVPAWDRAEGVPQIFEHSQEAGPDETLFLVGKNLSKEVVVWGHHPDSSTGKAVPAKVQLATDSSLAVTLPDACFDGPMAVSVKNAAGMSEPVVINAPQPWWCSPAAAAPGESVRVFGRNLACRPDFRRAHVWLTALGEEHGRVAHATGDGFRGTGDSPVGSGRWLNVAEAGKYAVRATLPADLKPGVYELWLHGGRGGAWGWGGPVRLAVRADRRPSRTVSLKPAKDGSLALQEALDALAARGGGTLRLPPGRFAFTGTLRVPQQVMLAGAGPDATALELATSPTSAFARLEAVGWNLAPGAIHSRGDTMTYDLNVPQAGRWSVWLRYATDMSPWKQVGVSGNTALRLDEGAWLALENLPNTGGFGAYRWSKATEMELSAGKHTLVWQNVKGGGLSLDAFVFMRVTDTGDSPAVDAGMGGSPMLQRGAVRDTGDSPVAGAGMGGSPMLQRGAARDTGDSPVEQSGAEPSDKPWPADSPTCVVLQAEACTRFACKEGTLPRSNQAAVWLSGDGAALEDLTVLGNAQVNQGIAIRAAAPSEWVSGCRVRRVRLADCEGKQGENCGVYARRLRGGSVCESELWGRTPLFLSGVRDTVFASNRLVSVTRYGGNSEAAILGRCEPVERCVIERNVVAAPAGAEAGGPTARRLIWLSTGHGSVSHNWLAYNGVEQAGSAGQARFGGVAGTDQNVGEMILFEGNHRTMFFGPLAGADPRSATLPATLPHTPDARLGSVKREQLAHDADGRETPFWPPDADDGSDEPPLGEYYVTVFSGAGQGQTRRVVARAGERLIVDRPWRVAPEAGSVVAVGTMFYQNLIVGNSTPDGMTGVQLWISCVENVVAGNTVARQRKPGLFLYANGTTLASSMPRTWNRGISPLFWNLAEGNRTDECSDGALVTSGDAAGLPVEFPRALGNVLRHNSFIRSRQNGVIVTSRKKEGGADRSASVVGTVVEFNVVRDAPVAYRAAEGSDAVVFRRDHAYAWVPAGSAAGPAVAFQLDTPAAACALEQNTVEGKAGAKDSSIVELKKSWEK